MIKKILSYGIVEGIAKGLNKCTLLFLPLLLSTSEYGKIGLLVAVEMLLPVMTLLGFEKAILRFYSDRTELKNFKKTIFSSIKLVHLTLLFLVVLFWYLGFDKLAGLDVFPDIFLVIILVYSQGSNLFYFNILRVSENHNKYFKARVSFQVVRFLLIFLLVYFSKSYLGYLIGAIFSAVFLNLFFTVSKYKEKEKYDKQTFSLLFLFSWPFIFHGVAGNILGNADKFIVENYLTLSDVGLYTLIYSISSIMIFAYVGISVYLEPMIYKENDFQKREILLNKFLFLSICCGIILFLIISFSSVFLLPLIYENSYHESIEYIPILAMGYLLFPFYLKSNYEMIYEKKAFNIALISIISAGVNIALNLIFIPKYGFLAAVLTTVFSYAIQAVLFVLMANKFRFNKNLFEVIATGSMLFLIIFYQLHFLFAVLGLTLFLLYLFFVKSRHRKKL